MTSDNVVRKIVTVNAPIEHVFEVFTQRFDSWWPRTHKTGKSDLKTAVLEGREGGRWYERGSDGTECEWGVVLAFAPPARLALSWHLNGSFQYDPDPQKASRVDVSFHAETEHRTRVELVHSGFERHGAEAEKVRQIVASDGGWPLLLDGFLAAAEA
ncbi:MAG: SRPBCC family protein [Deltaproteobacteria bacterium]